MRKKILGVFIVLIMIITCIGIIPNKTTVFAAEGYVEYTSSRGTGIPTKQYVNSNSYFYVSSKIPTCTGYTFQYWKTSRGTIYYPGDYAFFGTGALILNAVWEADTYTISYNANGGMYAPDEQEKVHGTRLKLSIDVPEREGYVFVGWGKTSNATTVAYTPGAYYTVNNSITLYAIWKRAYTISYNANGGMDAPDEQIKTHGVSIKLSSKKPIRQGYTFKGWSTNSSATRATYLAGATYTDNVSIALYAVWEKNKSNTKTEETTITSSNNTKKDNITNTNTSQNNTITNANISNRISNIKLAKVKFKLKAGKKKVTVKWSKVNGASGYTIYYKTSKKGKWKKLKNLSAKKTKYVKKKLKSGKKYYFTVKAYKKVNGKKVYGKFKIKKVKVK